MRILKLMPAVLLVLLFTFAFTACDDTTAKADTPTETTTQNPHGEGKEYTSAYVCPMHCDDSGSDKAGECPVCGMDYIAQAEHTENGHKH